MCIRCWGCLPAFKSRYKGLVDNIFPANPQDGLVKNNMEKLTFYALSSPEKLDRIGEYLAQRVARDLSRHRTGYVRIAMQAMDQLLAACHAQSLNLFVESFLKIIQQLLENSDYQMQLLATSSFVKFANIEEDTPSYHRRYDFFVSKFSAICHSSEKQLNVRCKLRVAGLCGIRGVIRKTVSDDLQVDIWDEHHMDKIVPSLLYNLQDKTCYFDYENGNYDNKSTNDILKYNEPLIKQPLSKNLSVDIIHPSFIISLDEEGNNQQQMIQHQHPQVVAEECLRELIGRANYGNIKSVIKPVLKHLDNHKLWNEENDFSKKIFKIIMYSIQSQHSYAVIQILMGHLDEKTKQQSTNIDQENTELDNIEVTTKVRTGIICVLSSIVGIAAAESIGPSVLEIINSLLNYLRNSIRNCRNLHNLDNESISDSIENPANDEKVFQDTIINTLGEFANNLPDFQKIEIMVFILNKVPQSDIYLQDILLKSLLKVSTKYKTVNMVQAFPSNFLNPLLLMSLTKDSQVRLTVQLIFHQLLDRHNNLNKLKNLVSLSSLAMPTIEKAFRQDLMFMKKHGNEILLHLYENFKFPNNNLSNFTALYTTLALLCVEMSTEDTLAELLRFIFAIQDLALACMSNNSFDNQTEGKNFENDNLNVNFNHNINTLNLTDLQICALHAIVAAYLHFTSQLTVIPAFCAHIEQVIKARDSYLKCLLPEHNELITEKSIEKNDADAIPINIESKLDQISEKYLFNKNTVVEALRSSGHDTTLLLTPFTPGSVVVDAKMSRSTSDLNSINVDVDSVNSSPGLPRKYPEEGITFESLRKVITDNSDVELRSEQRIQLIETYKTIAFDDLVNRQERKASDLQNRLNELFNKLANIKDIASLDSSRYLIKSQDIYMNTWSEIIVNNII